MNINLARITPQLRIISVRIMEMPKYFFDKMPEIYVTLEDNTEQFLFNYYPNEIRFNEQEFIGLTIRDARVLKFIKDKQFLQS